LCTDVKDPTTILISKGAVSAVHVFPNCLQTDADDLGWHDDSHLL